MLINSCFQDVVQDVIVLIMTIIMCSNLYKQTTAIIKKYIFKLIYNFSIIMYM